MDNKNIHWLTICVYACSISGVGTNNIALGKPATQSSVAVNGTADRAVDGNSNPHFFGHSCIHTLHGEIDQWWAVDLLAIYRITTVQIQNRGDNHGFKFHDFRVEVYKANPVHCPDANMTSCAAHPGAASLGENVNLTCADGAIGRYIKVLKLPEFITNPAEDILIICEVKVEGFPAQQCQEDRKINTYSRKKIISSNPPHVGLTRAECSRRCYYDNSCYGINIRVVDDECQFITDLNSHTPTTDSGWNLYLMC